MDCGPKFRVRGVDTEMMLILDPKLWDFLHLLFLVDMAYKIFTLICYVNTGRHFH